MDESIVNIAHGLLSELFKEKDETTPERVSAVWNWFLRNVDKEEVDEALWRCFDERMRVESVFSQDQDTPFPDEDDLVSFGRIRERLGWRDGPGEEFCDGDYKNTMAAVDRKD